MDMNEAYLAAFHDNILKLQYRFMVEDEEEIESLERQWEQSNG